MNILRNEELADKLAAEYVLGTLRGHARRRFEHWLGQSEALRRRVGDWERRLQPMGELSAAVPPPASVWNAVERRIGAAQATAAAPAATTPPAKSAAERKRNFWLGLREDLAFWRGLGMVSTAAALILVSVLLARQADVAPTPAPALSVAMLSNDKAQPVAVVTGDPAHDRLVVKIIAPQAVAADKSLQLWAVPAQGAPRSLGLLAPDGTMTLPLPKSTSPANAPLLAISLEPKGGSPNPDGPTGPILFKGAWVQT